MGTWVVRLAIWCGAEVVGTYSAGNMEFVKRLGATEVLDYRSVDVRTWAGEEGKKANLVVDCIGGKALEDAWWVVKDGGILVIACQPLEQKRPEGCEAKDVKNIFSAWSQMENS